MYQDIKISVSNAITNVVLSFKVQLYVMQVSAFSWLHGDKFWAPVNDISHASFSNVITSELIQVEV